MTGWRYVALEQPLWVGQRSLETEPPTDQSAPSNQRSLTGQLLSVDIFNCAPQSCHSRLANARSYGLRCLSARVAAF